jgi:hypothetical protein
LIQCMMRTGNGCTRARRRVVDLIAAVDITDQDINYATFGVVLTPREAAFGAPWAPLLLNKLLCLPRNRKCWLVRDSIL